MNVNTRIIIIENSFLTRAGLKSPLAFRNDCKEGIAKIKYSEKPIAEAAIGAEKPTISDNQPLKNPSNGLNSFVIKIYSPPASGKVAPSSPKAIAPQNAIIPPTNQSESINKGLPRKPIIKPEVVKIPAPIIFATTMLVTGKSPSFLGSLIFVLLKITVFIASKPLSRETIY
jgi:hypothetical protein